MGRPEKTASQLDSQVAQTNGYQPCMHIRNNAEALKNHNAQAACLERVMARSGVVAGQQCWLLL